MVAQGVDVGTNADALKLLPNQKDQVGDKLLAVAQVKFTNRGGDPVPEYPKVGDETELYVDGQPAQPLMMIGSAPEGCDRAVTIDTWPQGESHILCRSFLIPPTARALEVRWGADSEDPFIWGFNRWDARAGARSPLGARSTGGIGAAARAGTAPGPWRRPVTPRGRNASLRHTR